MAYSKEQVQRVRQAVKTSTKLVTPTLDGTTTSHVFVLGDVAAKVTYQGLTGLTATIEFSVDGITWSTPTAVSTAMTSYNTHNVCAIRVVRSAGSGTVSIAAK